MLCDRAQRVFGDASAVEYLLCWWTSVTRVMIVASDSATKLLAASQMNLIELDLYYTVCHNQTFIVFMFYILAM